VQALSDEGRYVAMVGDGVNDVPALKNSRLAIAQGSGTQMARSVSDLVLINRDFAGVPLLVAERRRALRNLQRVTKLYVTKSAFAAFVILTIGTSSDAYPLLPRHLSLAASLTIWIPTFFLALAPSSGAWTSTSAPAHRPQRPGRRGHSLTASGQIDLPRRPGQLLQRTNDMAHLVQVDDCNRREALRQGPRLRPPRTRRVCVVTGQRSSPDTRQPKQRVGDRVTP
jgi:hypothetical protein